MKTRRWRVPAALGAAEAELRSSGGNEDGGGSGEKEVTAIEFSHDRKILADGACNAPVPYPGNKVIAAKLHARPCTFIRTRGREATNSHLTGRMLNFTPAF